MDETSRLILVALISAGAAIFAGWGSATLTALANRKNAENTLAAAREDDEKRWQQQVAREHAVWLRDAKQHAYAKFLTAVTAAASNSYVPDASYSTDALMAYDEVRLIGPPEVIRAAEKIKQQIIKNGTLNANRIAMLPERDANSRELATTEERLSAGIVSLKMLTHSFATLARSDMKVP